MKRKRCKDHQRSYRVGQAGKEKPAEGTRTPASQIKGNPGGRSRRAWSAECQTVKGKLRGENCSLRSAM